MRPAIIKDDCLAAICPKCNEKIEIYVEVVIDDVDASIKASTK